MNARKEEVRLQRERGGRNRMDGGTKGARILSIPVMMHLNSVPVKPPASYVDFSAAALLELAAVTARHWHRLGGAAAIEVSGMDHAATMPPPVPPCRDRCTPTGPATEAAGTATESNTATRREAAIVVAAFCGCRWPGLGDARPGIMVGGIVGGFGRLWRWGAAHGFFW